MTDFWSQFGQYSTALGDDSSDTVNPSDLLPKLLAHAESERQTLEIQVRIQTEMDPLTRVFCLSRSLFVQFNPVTGAKKREENSSIISQLQNGISMTRKLLEQHDQLRNQERKLAIEMKSHESQAEAIAQEFRTIVKRLNNTTKIMDYLRCLETFLKYRYLSPID